MTKKVINKKAPALRSNSGVIQRARLAAYLGMQAQGSRDLYDVFGYKLAPTFEDYQAKYLRQDIAKRIINAPASATWRNSPTVKFSGNTTGKKQFLKKWDELVKIHRIYSVFETADRLAGIGNYSVLLLGLNDSNDFALPVSQSTANELLYIQPYSQSNVEILELDTNASSARFGLPTKYRIKMRDPFKGIATSTQLSGDGGSLSQMDVHYSRIVHIAEDALDNHIVGTPRLEGVYNLLDDLLKVVGGTSETFWLASYKGMQIDIDKDMEMDEESEAALSDEIEEYANKLRRFIRTRGVKINDLGSDVPDPKNTFDTIISLISGTTGIPRRILLGSELGQLASDQDRANWADRIKERRNNFAEPNVLIPFQKCMIAAGILPEVDLSMMEYVWPPNFELTPLEEAQSQAQKARAIINLSKHFKETPLCTIGEARQIVGLPSEPPEALPEAPEETQQGNTSTNPADDSEEEMPNSPDEE